MQRGFLPKKEQNGTYSKYKCCLTTFPPSINCSGWNKESYRCDLFLSLHKGTQAPKIDTKRHRHMKSVCVQQNCIFQRRYFKSAFSVFHCEEHFSESILESKCCYQLLILIRFGCDLELLFLTVEVCTWFMNTVSSVTPDAEKEGHMGKNQSRHLVPVTTVPQTFYVPLSKLHGVRFSNMLSFYT